MLTELREPLPEGCLSDLELDEWHAGELDATRARVAELHVASCHVCQARREALLDAASDFLQQYPQPPQRPSKRSRGRAVGLAVTCLALAAAVFIRLSAPRPTEAPERAFETRAKGGAKLGFFVKRGDRVFEGATGETVRAGDQLRFVVTSGSPKHIAILSRDGRGVASVYYPASAHSQALVAAGQTALDAAVELDATPGEEALFGIFCEAELELEPLRAELEKRGRLPALRGCAVDELRVFKEAR